MKLSALCFAIAIALSSCDPKEKPQEKEATIEDTTTVKPDTLVQDVQQKDSSSVSE